MTDEYQNLINYTIKVFAKTMFATIATSNHNGDISASQITIVNDNLDLYFQTDKNFEKIKNIGENNKVAVNFGNVYCKGIGKIVGHPLDNETFITQLKQKNPHSYNRYSALHDEVLVKIQVKEIRICQFEKINNKLEEVLTIIDVENNSFKKVLLSNIKTGRLFSQYVE